MHIEGCKHEIEIVVPVEEIDRATESVVSAIQKKARLPGFRPGKAPASLIRARFAGEVRQDVLEKVVPKCFPLRSSISESVFRSASRSSASITTTTKNRRARFDRRGKPEDFVPVSGEPLRVQYAADERLKSGIARKHMCRIAHGRADDLDMKGSVSIIAMM